MGFFDDLGDVFTKTIPGAFSSVKQGVVEPVYNEVVKPTVNAGTSFVSKYENKLDRLTESGVNTVDSLSRVLSSPWFLYAALGLGALLVIQVFRK